MNEKFESIKNIGESRTFIRRNILSLITMDEELPDDISNLNTYWLDQVPNRLSSLVV